MSDEFTPSEVKALLIKARARYADHPTYRGYSSHRGCCAVGAIQEELQERPFATSPLRTAALAALNVACGALYPEIDDGGWHHGPIEHLNQQVSRDVLSHSDAITTMLTQQAKEWPERIEMVLACYDRAIFDCDVAILASVEPGELAPEKELAFA